MTTPPQSHYLAPAYCTNERFAGYAEQYRAVMAHRPASVLDVGLGSGLLAFLLDRAGVAVISLDVDSALRPDVVGDVRAPPLPPDAVDVAACFEVLEHLPFDDLVPALKELRRVSRHAVLMSVPNVSPVFRFFLPPASRIGRLTLPWPFWRRQPLVFKGEHHWEIERQGFPLGRITDAFTTAGLVVAHSWRPWDDPYHHFFRLEPA